MLAVCIDERIVVIIWLAVHVIISHNYLCIIYSAVALMFFWISENGAKWNIEVNYTTHRSYEIEEKLTLPGFELRKYSTAIHCTPSWATTLVGELVANSHNESTYLHITSIFRKQASCVYRHFVSNITGIVHQCLCIFASQLFKLSTHHRV